MLLQINTALSAPITAISAAVIAIYIFYFSMHPLFFNTAKASKAIIAVNEIV